ncbi:DUF1003 domain-containing protein [Herbiconiux liangxiaofengii]|uniref:DUF1003 domain-containing protein n=1 Tax=Herbiconiux liangxiaofengii TaxID=3342795 RepID=UPI0035B6D3EA
MNTPGVRPHLVAHHRVSARPSPTQNWHREHIQTLTRGQRAADRLRNVMGSWAFVIGFLVFMLVWAASNTVGADWDPYPFILLNLFLSMLAGLQGAILLIAAKRQDGIAAALAQHDYETNVAARIDIESVLEINRQQLVMITELRDIITRRADPTSPTESPSSSRTVGASPGRLLQ